jgi:hypothetical protein
LGTCPWGAGQRIEWVDCICWTTGLRWYVRREVLLPRLKERRIGMGPPVSLSLSCVEVVDLGLCGDRLLRAAEEAMIPGSTVYVEIVDTIRIDHIQTAGKLIRDKEILGRVEREIEFECKGLDDFLNAAQVWFCEAMEVDRVDH